MDRTRLSNIVSHPAYNRLRIMGQSGTKFMVYWDYINLENSLVLKPGLNSTVFNITDIDNSISDCTPNEAILNLLKENVLILEADITPHTYGTVLATNIIIKEIQHLDFDSNTIV